MSSSLKSAIRTVYTLLGSGILHATTFHKKLVTGTLICFLTTHVHAGVVLLYHHVDEKTPAITSIAPDQFNRHLDIIEAEGFTVLPLDELVKRSMDVSRETEKNDDKIVAITFDDAYRSIYSTAFPNLQARGWPFTIFVSTRLIEQKNPHYLTWAQLAEMSMHGATIANHTDSHTHMIRRLDAELADQWRDRMRGELLTAKNLLGKHGLDSNLFAYPYGEYDEEILNLVGDLGMIGFGQQSGAIGPYSNPLILPRYPLAGVYVGEAAFRDKLRSLPFPVLHPEVEPLVSDNFKPPLELSFTNDSLNFSRLTCYGPGGLMALSETSGTKVLARPTKEVSVGRTRYNCTLPKGNRFYWFSQLWIRKQSDGSWYHEP
ncbi:MAG: polysaccharide deacetylase family protein [Gammaproteobacteria bacterium]|nr:polysaccharide deacetylase family protein [Gammaproteobacteria bacterium]